MSPTLPLALKKCKSVSPDQCHINVEPCPPFLLPLCRAAGDRRQLPEKWENLGKIVGKSWESSGPAVCYTGLRIWMD